MVWDPDHPIGTGHPARLAPSRYMRLVTRVLATEPKLMAEAATFREAYRNRTYPQAAPVPAALRAEADVATRMVDGRIVHVVTPRQGGSDWTLMYLHGGGYVDALIRIHWDIVLDLVRVTGATAWLPMYPLAPEHTHRQGNDFVQAVYVEMLRETDPSRIVLAGDSAGGGMALVQAMRYRDAGLPAPARLVLFSPCTNVVPDNPDIDAIEPLDVILARPGGALAGRWWAGDDDPSHPQVSPLFGDPSNLPPVDIYMGTADILWPDVRLMAERIALAGGACRLVEYPGAIHVFVGATFTPEARDVFRRVAASLGVPSARLAPMIRLANAPEVVLSRQLLLRASARSTPWIRHVGARAHLHLPRRGDRIDAFLHGPPDRGVSRPSVETTRTRLAAARHAWAGDAPRRRRLRDDARTRLSDLRRRLRGLPARDLPAPR